MQHVFNVFSKGDAAPMGFGERFREIREKKLKYSQGKLAEILGVKQSYIFRYEKGISEPSFSMLMRFAEISDCDLHWLITGKTHEPDQMTVLTDKLTLDRNELVRMGGEIAELRREMDRIRIAQELPQHEGIPAEVGEDIRQLTGAMGSIMAKMVARAVSLRKGER